MGEMSPVQKGNHIWKAEGKKLYRPIILLFDKIRLPSEARVPHPFTVFSLAVPRTTTAQQLVGTRMKTW